MTNYIYITRCQRDSQHMVKQGFFTAGSRNKSERPTREAANGKLISDSQLLPVATCTIATKNNHRTTWGGIHYSRGGTFQTIQVYLSATNLWLETDGKVWLDKMKQFKHLICYLILEIQSVIALYVHISNSLNYRQAVKMGNPVAPQAAYEEANSQANATMFTARNMIHPMNIGCFTI